MKINAYKVEVLIIDFDGLGAKGIIETLENTRYPNHCMSPDVKSIVGKEIEWSDDHPLNNMTTSDEAYSNLFHKNEN